MRFLERSMDRGWQRKRLGEVIELQYGKNLPSAKRVKAGEVNVYGSNGVVGRHNEALVTGPHIIIGRKGSVGKIHFEPDRSWPIDTTFYVEQRPSYDVRFLANLLRTLGLEDMNSDAAVPGLNRKAALSVEAFFPPLEEQKLIAKALSSIESRMQFKEEMNGTLEDMARALFRDWFVDFGPTRRQRAGATDPIAIMGGAFPAEKAATLAPLFPPTLGEDGLPESWIKEALGERVTVKRGGSPRPIKDFIRPEGIPWVKIADATKCKGPNLFETREFIKEEGLRKTVELQAGSLILSNSATPGLPKFLRLRACIHDGWLYFPDTGGLSNEFLYLAFLHFKEVIVSQATGSVFNNLKTDVLKRQEFVFPPAHLLTEFDAVVGLIFNKILANEEESQTLSSLRDLLLPKLMAGEIRLVSEGNVP